MAQPPPRPAPVHNYPAYIFGGIFLGFWVYGILFGFEWHAYDQGLWILWGFIGLVIAGGLYGARVAEDTVRIIVILVVGIAVGVILLAVILQEEEMMLATFLTLIGGGLVAAAVPRINTD